MRIGSKIVHLISSLYVLLALTACVEEELRQPMLGKGEGYLTLQVGPISAEVQAAPLTKATTTLEEVPAVNELKINVTSGGTQVSGFPKPYADLSAPIVLPTGTYTVEAYYGENEALQTTPYFYGSTSIEVKPNQNNTASFTVALGNAMITPIVTESLSKHYESWTLTANAGGISKELASSSNQSNRLYAKAGETLGLTFEGTNKLGLSSTSSWATPNVLERNKDYQFQCDPSFAQCASLVLSATINPIIESDWLKGSEVSLSHSSPNGATTTNITAWHADVTYNGQVIRSYEGSAPQNTTMTQTEGWPYIPKGSQVSAYVVIEGDEIPIQVNTTENPIRFGIDVAAETSYSVYTKSGAAEANKIDGSSIVNIGSTVKISSEILNKYPELLSEVTYKAEEANAEPQSTSAAVGSKTSLSNLSWAQHQLTASVTFDQTMQTSSALACDVTGLPYSANPPKNTGNHPWTEDQTNWGVEYFNWGDREINMYVDNVTGSCIKIGSPLFYIPFSSIPVTIDISAHGYYEKRLLSTTKVNVKSKIYVSSLISKEFTVEHNNGKYKSYTFSDLSLDSSLSKIQIENAELGGYKRLYIESVAINYRK